MRIIAGEARGRHIDAPRGQNTRPTLDRVRENIFNMIQNEVPGSRVLDLFSGSGALSLEALSRGAVSAVLVDSDRNAHEIQKRNIQSLGYAEKTRQFFCDWKKAVARLQTEEAAFDLVFLDPPYAMTDLRAVFSSLVPLVTPGTIVVLEHEAGKEAVIPETYTVTKHRSWGFCAAAFCRIKSQGE